MRCREVCPGWLDLLCDTSLWTVLDVSGDLSLSLPRACWLRAASRLSGHTLTKIVGYGCMFLEDKDVRNLVAVNGATLREVCLGMAAEPEAGQRKRRHANPVLRRLCAADISFIFEDDGRRLSRSLTGWDYKSA